MIEQYTTHITSAHPHGETTCQLMIKMTNQL
jgi:hypothetical protein